MRRWNKLKAGFVSGKNDILGLLTWWINLSFDIAVFIRVCAHGLFDYDLPLFSDILPLLFARLGDRDPVGKVLMLPLFFISLSGLLLTLFSLLIEPRKTRTWGGVMLIVGVIYIVFDLPALVIAKCLNSPLLHGSFFWSQLFFDLLMLCLLILKIRIRKRENEEAQP